MVGDDLAKYQAALDRVKKSAIDIFAIARRGNFSEVRGDDVIVEFDAASSAMAKIMEMPNNLERMSGALSECFGREVRYKPMIRQAAPAKAKAGDLGPVYDAFGLKTCS